MFRTGFWSARTPLTFAAFGLLFGAATAAPAATVGTITAEYDGSGADNTTLHITNSTGFAMTGVSLTGTYGSDTRIKYFSDIAGLSTLNFDFPDSGGPFSVDFDDFNFGEASYTFSATLNGAPVTGSFSPSSNASGGFVGFLGNDSNGYESDANVSPTVVAYLSGTLYTFSGFLQPINTDGSSIFKFGSTVPVKFTLSPNPATPVSATLTVAKVSNGVAGSDVEAISTSAATTGNLFRSDATSGQYIFNWGTKGLSTGAGTYQLTITLAGGQTYSVLVSLK